MLVFLCVCRIKSKVHRQLFANMLAPITPLEGHGYKMVTSVEGTDMAVQVISRLDPSYNVNVTVPTNLCHSLYVN